MAKKPATSKEPKGLPVCGLYIVRDNTMNEPTNMSFLYLHRAVQQATRFFNDILSMKDSVLANHPADFDLIQVGTMDSQGNITPCYETVMTGATWKAMQGDNNA